MPFDCRGVPIVPGTITYLIGDATRPNYPGLKYIVHICNDIGAWGSGFVMALSRRWREPEALYRAWSKRKGPSSRPFELGQVQLVPVEKDVHVVNMVAQRSINTVSRVFAEPPIRYGSLAQCLLAVSELVMDGATVHMPRIGSDRAGGDWTEIVKIIESTLCYHGVNVFVYDLPKGK